MMLASHDVGKFMSLNISVQEPFCIQLHNYEINNVERIVITDV